MKYARVGIGCVEEVREKRLLDERSELIFPIEKWWELVVTCFEE